ncbi:MULTISPECIES: aldo/keto reductase [Pacificibacter]|uniref:aldo/keto reductase n=1 Tax=Pacificibacter TaxID=1042323 RepID=UPI001C09C97C|nr:MULTISPECIES: aldo/keto reductase [Pacificibacter]MBU2937165.1 aldo/keto reductase [Pacificibacter marinus]MDO6617015.1 aldo/keto reductase [Pacificibacter sp. 1_MG-2023]
MKNAIKLNDGHSLPRLGLGVWQIPNDDTAGVVSTAINAGYRLIDGAFIYGNEEGMGKGIVQSDVARDALFVTSKVWNSEQGYDKARRAIEDSLKRIGLEYLNMCLIHWPCPVKDQYVDTWKALIAAQKDGQIRSIGVSNFNPDHLDRIIGETGVSPVVNQIEVNPRLIQEKMRAENKSRNIVTQSWTPMGQLASFGAPAIVDICNRLERTPAQVILRWHLQLGASVIPRSTEVAHLTENLAAADFELSDKDMAAISALDEGQRCGPDPVAFEDE